MKKALRVADYLGHILEAIEMTVNRDLFELYPQIRALRSGFTE